MPEADNARESSESTCDRLRAELLEARHLREVLLSSAAHDLRNPLNTLSMSLGLLRDELEQPSVDSNRALSLVARMTRASSKLQGLIDNLLDASRIESGSIDMSPRACSATAAARKAVDRAQPTCTERSITLESGAFDSNAMIDVDPPRFVDALVHVLALCQKAAGNGARLRLDLDDRPSGVAFVFRAWTARATPVVPPLDEGSGGLSFVLARGLAELQGGSLRVETDAEGARVVLLLPSA